MNSGDQIGPIRDAFIAWIEEGADATEIEFDGNTHSITWLLDQLHDCTDILPGVYCDDLGIPEGSTYADAAIELKIAAE